MIAAGGADETSSPVSTWWRWRSLAAIWAVAILIMLPELLGGPSFSFSFSYNFLWASEFSRLFLAGDPWPRWMPLLWDGLGSPSFYFYPPLYFWVVSLVRAASFETISVATATSVATLVILGVSGVAMRAWLCKPAGERAALVGAICYMLAPYRLDDIYTRGALAEVTAYALLPLAMILLRRLAAAGGPGDIAWLALVYALLMLCHLPVALLTSVTLLPAAMLWWASREGGVPFLMRSAVAIALGLGLAACYWYPAMVLRPYVSWDAMGGDYFRIDRWFFFTRTFWQVSFPAFLTLAASLLALAALVKSRSGDALLWVGLILVSALLISGALPFVWKLPGLREVQFAWRLLVVVEFTVVTLLVTVQPRLTHPLTLAGVMALFAAVGIMLVGAKERAEAGWDHGATGRAASLSRMTDAPEYLPAGYPIGYDEWGRADRAKFVAPSMPLARSEGASSLTAVPAGDGGILVRVTADARVRVIARRFAFPGWVASDGETTIQTLPYGRDRLVSWIAPAGSHTFHLYRERPASERVGLAVSGVVMVLMLGIVLYGRRRRAP